MLNTIGAWLPKTESSSSLIKDRPAGRELAVLLGLGIAAVVLHAATRDLIEIPGHQGSSWVALLMAGRPTSRFPWAAVTSALGAGGFALMPFWSFNDPFRWLTYLLAGVTLDLLYLALL